MDLPYTTLNIEAVTSPGLVSCFTIDIGAAECARVVNHQRAERHSAPGEDGMSLSEIEFLAFRAVDKPSRPSIVIMSCVSR